jgi:23S rRNA pseudouridine2605 synthase
MKQRQPHKRIIKDEELTRLNKYIAGSGKCSRREADELIRSGRVSVNKKTITELGTRVKAGDEVSIDGQLIKSEKKIYILLNKPKDVITTTDDPEGRKTVLDLVKIRAGFRVFPVGRLDRNTTGVLLLTNDGDLTGKLTHPRYLVKKVYELNLTRGLRDEDLEKLAKGIELEDGKFVMDKISFLDPNNRKQLGVEIHSGRNRIIRRSFEHLGYEVAKLDRVMFAGLTKKNLPRGKYRILSPREVAYLKMSNFTK